MKVFRGYNHPQLAAQCALTIGNFDGVHRGHQAMLALLKNEAQHRGVPSCVMSFEPHPRDYFAAVARKPELAPARIATLRDKLTELARCGIDQCVVLPFNARLAAQPAQTFIEDVLVKGLGARYVLVGDDFRFGAKRAGDYAMLDAAGEQLGFDVARMNSYEIPDPHARTYLAAPQGGVPALGRPGGGRSTRVSSSAVREALGQGQMSRVAGLLGRPYSISGHVVHGRKLGRDLGFRTLNLRFSHWKPAASGIFAVQVFGLSDQPLPGVANLGIRPSLDPADVNGGRVLLETHCLAWPAGLGLEEAYGKIIRVELLHKLHDELKYDGLDSLKAGIARDCDDARTFFAEAAKSFSASMHTETSRQTTRDRI
ncbi:MAG: bifunctional riboflavin kinase/FMN adenylyltransferase [Polaromonas sp.]|uniref:bifunctional riboflavin kinase/FMN adenylyltransferase n=1 Tax=Polaromonas sp. TaxID=1869339 RepID=UPI0024888B70|nr:bifunctional riboflavin kinase/FMN adenylyltransferase [Polaromonas sp.]MDI1270012.1 bifunctional riboflavin kinase/FMN adenylyltransferase [Polaromonas sp.]